MSMRSYSNRSGKMDFILYYFILFRILLTVLNPSVCKNRNFERRFIFFFFSNHSYVLPDSISSNIYLNYIYLYKSLFFEIFSFFFFQVPLDMVLLLSLIICCLQLYYFSNFLFSCSIKSVQPDSGMIYLD